MFTSMKYSKLIENDIKYNVCLSFIIVSNLYFGVLLQCNKQMCILNYKFIRYMSIKKYMHVFIRCSYFILWCILEDISNS